MEIGENGAVSTICGASGTYQWRRVGTQTQCYPAIEYVQAVPAYLIRDVGWTAGGVSIAQGADNFYTAFRVDAGLDGALVGLSRTTNQAYSFSSCSHAWLVDSGRVAVVENGSSVFEAESDAEGIQEFRIDVVGNKVIYRLNGVAVYESSQAPPTAWVLKGVIYSSAVVFDPTIAAIGGGLIPMVSDPVVSFTMSTIVKMLSDALVRIGPRSYAVPMLAASRALFNPSIEQQSSVSMLSQSVVRLQQELVGYMAGSFPAPEGLASESQSGAMHGEFPVFTLRGELGPPKNGVALMTGVAPRPYLLGLVMVGAFGRMEEDWPSRWRGIAAEDDALYGNMVGNFQVPIMLAYQGSSNLSLAEVGCGMVVSDSVLINSSILIVVEESMSVYTFASIIGQIDLSAIETITVGDNVTVGQLLTLIATEQLIISNDSSSDARLQAQYAVSVGKGAITQYQDFDFDGFFRDHKGDTYGWKKDGIYRVERMDEDSSPIQASIDFGGKGFGAAQLKYLSDVFVGIATDGEIYLRAAADNGQPIVYRVLNGQEDGRASLAKGVKARHWRLHLEIVDATSAELSDVEFNVGLSTRRQNKRK